MAAIATTAAGDWSNTATWSGGVVPGDGDTATISHAVTVDTNTVVGSAPATGGTAAIAVNATLTLAAGVTLEVKGDIIVGNVGLIMGAGASILGNAASGVSYKIQISTGHNQASARLTANGSSGSLCTIRKKSGAAGTFRGTDGGFLKGGLVTATDTEFLALGSASVNGWNFWPSASEPMRLDNCVVDGCGTFAMTSNIAASSSIRFRGTPFKNGLRADDLTLVGGTGLSSGERILDRCSFEKNLNVNVVGFLMTECRMAGGISGGSNGPNWHADSANNIVLSAASAGNAVQIATNAAPKRWYVVRDVASNPHFIQPTTARSQTFDQCIMEAVQSPVDGDGFVLPSPGSARTYAFKRCYLLPNAAGTSPGKFIAGLGNANCSFEGEHNTYIVGGGAEQGVLLGETFAGVAGMLASLKSNLAWCTSGTGYYLGRLAGTVQDLAYAADVDYNAAWGLSAGSDGGGVHVTSGPNFFSAGGHNPNGVTLSGDPFVDKARNIAAWDASLGGAGTYANARAALLALTAGYDVEDLIDYIIAGFVVTDPALEDAGHDGATIGASGYQPGSTSVEGTAVCPAEWLAVANAVRHKPVEHLGPVTGATLVAVESLADLSRLGDLLSEHLSAASGVSALALELTGGVVAGRMTPAEHLAALERVTSFLGERLASAAAGGAAPLESLVGLHRATTLLREHLASMVGNGGPSLEHLGSRDQSVVLLAEHIATVAGLESHMLEHLTGLGQAVTAPTESLGLRIGLAAMPVEQLHALGAIGALPMESLAGLSASAALPRESLQGLSAPVVVPLEWMGVAELQGVAVVPLEWLGVVTASRSVAVESLADRAAAASMALEWLSGLEAGITFPVAPLGGLSAVVQLPAEWLAARMVAAGVSLEVLAEAQAAAGVPVEMLGGVEGLVSIPLEWLFDGPLFELVRMEQVVLLLPRVTDVDLIMPSVTGVSLLCPSCTDVSLTY